MRTVPVTETLYLNQLMRLIAREDYIVYIDTLYQGVLFYGEGPRSRSYRRTAALRLIVQSCDKDEEKGGKVFYFSKYWSTSGMKLTGENQSTREKPVPVPLCPPQIPHGLTRDRTRGLRGGRPVTNRLSRGTALTFGIQHGSLYMRKLISNYP
jgi:hypothetical protein